MSNTKSAAKANNKDQHYWKVLDAVVRLEVVKGHLRWKISDVSRLSGVQRTLIYYYFGKSKENILKTAMKSIGDEIFGLSPERVKLWAEGRVRESILLSRAQVQKAPHVAEFFFHWRHQSSDVQETLLDLEKRNIQKFKTYFPQLKEAEVKALYSILFGLVIFPELPEPVLDSALSLVPILGKRG